MTAGAPSTLTMLILMCRVQTIDVIIGTYSSIYIAANMLIALKISKEDLAIPVKENADQQDAGTV